VSENALRKQPDPTGDFEMEASSQRTDADLWEAFHAAQGAGSPKDEGSATTTDEQLPPGEDPLDLRPLQQQFQEREVSGGQRPTDPTAAFGGAPVTSSAGESDGMSSFQLPPGDEPVDHRPLRIRFQEGER